MDTSSAFASLPAPLIRTYKTLRKELKKGIDQPRHTEHLFNKGEICESVKRFIDEFRKEPTWGEELNRRAFLVSLMCGENSAFAQAMHAALETEELVAAWKAYIEHFHEAVRPNLSGLTIALEHLSTFRQPPSSLTSVVNMRHALASAIENSISERPSHRLTQPTEVALNRWLEQCRKVEGMGAGLEVDGCDWLSGVHKDMTAGMQRSGKPAGQRDALGGMLQEMLAAAKSLMVWAAKNPVVAAIAPPNDQGNEAIGQQAATQSEGTADADRIWYNATDAARYIRVDESTVRRWIHSHTIGIYGEEGTKYWFSLQELNAKREVQAKKKSSRNKTPH